MRKIFSLRSVLFAFFVLALTMAATTPSVAAVAISVSFGPPALPVYEQPICPGDGYIWTPGYWAWDSDFGDYYWVPGTWILAPQVGYLWTPPYWGWVNGAYLFYPGYWGPQVGFYGGVVYGFGYFGVGFVGGRWDGGHFFYNRAVANINVVNIHNVYEERVTNVTVNHISYNGGPGGINVRPTPQQEAYGREQHMGPVGTQVQHMDTARGNPQLRATENHGKPPIAATGRPNEFSGREVAGAKEAGGKYNAPTHANEVERPEPVKPNTGDANRDREYQQEQEKMNNQHEQERQQLQRQQDQEHQQAARQNAGEAQRQQMEVRHQQQTQQMQQRQFQQRQSLQQRYSPPPSRGGGQKK